jgi:hypothetical protein
VEHSLAVFDVYPQSLHASLHPEGNVPIAWWLLAYGVIQLALSQVPTMHHLRHLNAAAAVMTAVWTIMMFITIVQTGAQQSFLRMPSWTSGV